MPAHYVQATWCEGLGLWAGMFDGWCLWGGRKVVHSSTLSHETRLVGHDPDERSTLETAVALVAPSTQRQCADNW